MGAAWCRTLARRSRWLRGSPVAALAGLHDPDVARGLATAALRTAAACSWVMAREGCPGCPAGRSISSMTFLPMRLWTCARRIERRSVLLIMTSERLLSDLAKPSKNFSASVAAFDAERDRADVTRYRRRHGRGDASSVRTGGSLAAEYHSFQVDVLLPRHCHSRRP